MTDTGVSPLSEPEFKGRTTLREILNQPKRRRRHTNAEERMYAAHALYDLRRSTTLESYLAHRVGVEAAQDIAQETYIRFFLNPNIRELTHPAGYLFCIAKRVMWAYWRQRDRDPVCFDSSVYDYACLVTADESSVRAEEQVSVEERFENMKWRMRKKYLRALELRYCERLSHEKIAARLGISKKSVSKYLARATVQARSFFPEYRKRFQKRNRLRDQELST